MGPGLNEGAEVGQVGLERPDGKGQTQWEQTGVSASSFLPHIHAGPVVPGVSVK